MHGGSNADVYASHVLSVFLAEIGDIVHCISSSHAADGETIYLRTLLAKGVPCPTTSLLSESGRRQEGCRDLSNRQRCIREARGRKTACQLSGYGDTCTCPERHIGALSADASGQGKRKGTAYHLGYGETTNSIALPPLAANCPDTPLEDNETTGTLNPAILNARSKAGRKATLSPRYGAWRGYTMVVITHYRLHYPRCLVGPRGDEVRSRNEPPRAQGWSKCWSWMLSTGY
jgi:hypothetical protein